MKRMRALLLSVVIAAGALAGTSAWAVGLATCKASASRGTGGMGEAPPMNCNQVKPVGPEGRAAVKSRMYLLFAWQR